MEYMSNKEPNSKLVRVAIYLNQEQADAVDKYMNDNEVTDKYGRRTFSRAVLAKDVLLEKLGLKDSREEQ